MSDEPIKAAMTLMLEEEDRRNFNIFLSRLAHMLRTLDETRIGEIVITDPHGTPRGVLMTSDRYREFIDEIASKTQDQCG